MLDIDALRTLLTTIETDNAESLNDEGLRAALQEIHAGFAVSLPIFAKGTIIYRAVKIAERPAAMQRVSYPPSKIINVWGRANRPKESMFYGSLDQWLTCLEECRWKPGERFAISAWLTTADMMLAHLGYSTEVYQELKTVRELPRFSSFERDSERNNLVRRWQSRVFTKHVPAGSEHLYRLPNALKEHFLIGELRGAVTSQNRVSGLVYPSIAFYALGDNIALVPSEVDTKMKLFEVIFLELLGVEASFHSDGSNETKKTIRTIDFARPDANGNLVWNQRSQLVFPDGVDASTQPQPRVLIPNFNNESMPVVEVRHQSKAASSKASKRRPFRQ